MFLAFLPMEAPFFEYANFTLSDVEEQKKVECKTRDLKSKTKLNHSFPARFEAK